jgi:hypothetical protein
MNRRLFDSQIRSTCRELLSHNARLSGRQLRRELYERYGAVGKNARVFQIWREEAVKPPPNSVKDLPTDIRELQTRLRRAEEIAAENLARAELAEYRERAHQDHWAVEIVRLREQVAELRAGQGASTPFRV